MYIQIVVQNFILRTNLEKC